jgi:Pyridoxamine 5'-phosphate oxidase
MSTELTPEDLELLRGENFAWIVTLSRDGSPAASIMWIDATDTHVLVNTAVGRRKDRNVERDPRVTVAWQRHGDAYFGSRSKASSIGARWSQKPRRTSMSYPGATTANPGRATGPATRALARSTHADRPVQRVGDAAVSAQRSLLGCAPVHT